jgi:hypothetical protein
MTQAFEPRESPDIDSVWRWFEFQIGLIREEQGRILGILASGGEIEVGHSGGHVSPFIGLGPREVVEFFDEQAGYLELLVMFELLATTEAILRIEFDARVKGRRKDSLSRRFRDAYKLRGERIRLDQDILAALKDAGVGSRIVAAFRGTLRLRDWLAHGRHWHPRLGRGYTPDGVLGIARELIDSIPA